MTTTDEILDRRCPCGGDILDSEFDGEPIGLCAVCGKAFRMVIR
jgi:hypothetical protein